MALVRCRECGAKVSSSAETCPHCGIRKPAGASDRRILILIVLLVIGGFALFGKSIQQSEPEKAPPTQEEAETAAAAKREADAAEAARCATDLRCLAEKHIVEATTRCRRQIERLAINNFEWVDHWYESKLSHYRWKDQQKQMITYLGDKIKYQNGFGAWTLSIYECDYDSNNKVVLDVRARPGRLPE
jgi:zinc ribbon protein